MQPLPQRVLYYGVDEPTPEQIELRAGPLALIYESGDLRSIRFGEREVLRRVYVALRDHNWDTIPAVLSNVQVATADDSFQISYTAEHRHGPIYFAWRATITGNSAGTITFGMDGIAHSTFLRNRIGFCVLHPIRECAGQPCRVEHVTGEISRSSFPAAIAPHQPFKDMRAITHKVAPGLAAEVRFAGETFEMEDQRNWTDASFKTYCTPLDAPFPIEVAEGRRITQSVTLTLRRDEQAEGGADASDGARARAHSTAPSATMPISTSFELRPGPDRHTLPPIGLGVASHGQPLSQHELARLRRLNLAHLRVDLRLADRNYPATLRRAAGESAALGIPLEVALILSDRAAEELSNLVGLLEEIQPTVGVWLVFHEQEKATTRRWAELTRHVLRAADPQARIGGGTNAYFAELNRNRPPTEALDLVSYSINPQVHAFDNTSLVETLEAQPATVDSARLFCGDLPLAISPVTLLPRFNPNATGPEPQPEPGAPPPQVDLRQMSLFGAGWTVGSIKSLAESGVASVTYYETTGWCGVMESASGSPLPQRFRSLPGAVFPLYHVLADVGEYAGGKVHPFVSSHPQLVDGLALQKHRQTRVILANLSGRRRAVRVEWPGGPAAVRLLDETNAVFAMQFPEEFRSQPAQWLIPEGGVLAIDLLPYAIARIDSAQSE